MGSLGFISSFLDIRTILLCTIIFLTIFWYLKRPRNLPPGPLDVIPVLGCLPTLSLDLVTSGLKPHELMNKYSAKYGNTFCLNLLGLHVVILNSYEAIKAAYQNPKLNDRPRPVLFEELNYKQGVAIASGDLWKRQRKFTLTSLRGFGFGKKSFAEQISMEAEALIDAFTCEKGNPFNPRHLVGNAVSNVICSVIFGKRYDYTRKDFEYILNNLNNNVRLIGAGGFHIFVPFAKYIQPKTRKLIEDNFKLFFDFINEIIDEHRESHDAENPRDFIDVFLTETNPTESDGIQDPESYIDREELVTTIVNLFAAGSETTATTICWGLMYMIALPEVQKKIQQELDSVVGRDRNPRLSDKPDLPYTTATINEVLRITSIVSLGVIHVASDDTIFKGYNIPKGTFLLSNLWSVHHNPDTWVDPEKFRPERFLDGHGNIQERAELIPFSIGRRACLGENLANMELFLFFSNTFHQFTVTKPVDSAPLSFDGLGGAINGPEATNIILSKRD